MKTCSTESQSRRVHYYDSCTLYEANLLCDTIRYEKKGKFKQSVLGGGGGIFTCKIDKQAKKTYKKENKDSRLGSDVLSVAAGSGLVLPVPHLP